MKKQYGKPIRFQARTLELIQNINTALDECGGCTIRQLFYMLNSRNQVPSLTYKSYANLITAARNGRMAGLIDWDLIHDSLAEPIGNTAFRVHVVTDKYALIPQLRQYVGSVVGVHYLDHQPSSGVLEWFCRRIPKNAIVLQLTDWDLRGLSGFADLQKRISQFTPTVSVRRAGLFGFDGVELELQQLPQAQPNHMNFFELESLPKQVLKELVINRVMEIK